MSQRCYLCNKKRDRLNNITLHSFPKDAITCEKWVEACGLTANDDLKNVRICGNHFSLHDFIAETSTKIARLKKGALPSFGISKRNSVSLSHLATAELAVEADSQQESPKLGNCGFTGIESDTTHEDIKFDVYKVQEQWVRDKQQNQYAATSASTLTILPAFNTAESLSTAPVLQKTLVLECKAIKNECARIERDSSIDSVRNETEVAYNRHVGKSLVMPTVCEGSSSQRKTNYTFGPDVVDLQETDSDEDGYSDIDFDEEFQQIEYWLEQPVIPNSAETTFPHDSCHGLREEFFKSNTLTSYFYKLLGGTKFFQTLAECCNKRAIQNHKDSAPIEAYSAKEISIFIGICLQMGSMQFTTLAEYWETQAYYHVNGFSKKLSYEGFKSILEHLNFEDFQPETLKRDHGCVDKLHNLRSLVYFFNTHMEIVYNCGKDLILNEPMMYWKGRLNWLKDMKKKFRPNAVLLHFLSEQRGLVLKICMDIVCPERKLINENSKELVIERLSTATELLEEKLKRGHMVFVSKYYSSYALAFELAKLGTYTSGLIEQTRFGNSRELVLQNLSKTNQSKVRYANFIMMGKCRQHDKNIYFYTSNPDDADKNEFEMEHCLQLLTEIQDKLKTPKQVRDRMLCYQLALESTEIQWNKRLMIYIIDLLLHNAFLLYSMDAQNETTTNKLNLLSYQIFRKHIITSLLNPKCVSSEMEQEEKSVAQKIVAQNLQSLQLHVPKKVPPLEGKYTRKRCRLCNKSGFVSYSGVCCRLCSGMPGLCETPCFQIWHDRMRKRIMDGNDK